MQLSAEVALSRKGWFNVTYLFTFEKLELKQIIRWVEADTTTGEDRISLYKQEEVRSKAHLKLNKNQEKMWI